MLVVDSTVWIDYFNGAENPQTDFLDRTLDKVPILVGDLILAEVLQGFRQDADFETACRLLTRFTQLPMVNPELAIRSAHNYRFLRQKGLTVRKTIDSLIAAFCIENDHELLHNDSDFDGYEKYLGLMIVYP
ncbi:MAG: PIN domain nuclease [Anaerolineales bacterium]|nr:PIN domain nuclease [Anaerolineales bacterium]